MLHQIQFQGLLKRHIALPQDHGSWVFLFSPLSIGIFTASNISISTGYLIVASLAAFLIRQPITTLIKINSGRRSKRDSPAAWFWSIIYSLIGFFGLFGLISQGYIYLLYLLLPGIPVFVWHLWLVSRRAERRQVGVEIVASGVLSLTATAGYWVGIGEPDPVGWLLFLLTWLQSAASIVYAYLRLGQRELQEIPTLQSRIRMGRRALLYTSFNMLLVTALSLAGQVSTLLPLPYALQWFETIWGTLKPAISTKPTLIGLRQLIISTIFTILFILTWHK